MDGRSNPTMYYLLNPSALTMAPFWDPPRGMKYQGGGNDSSRWWSTPRAKGSPPPWSPPCRMIATSAFCPPCQVPPCRCATTQHTWPDRKTTNSRSQELVLCISLSSSVVRLWYWSHVSFRKLVGSPSTKLDGQQNLTASSFVASFVDGVKFSWRWSHHSTFHTTVTMKRGQQTDEGNNLGAPSDLSAYG